jgi:hypothetical protein
MRIPGQPPADAASTESGTASTESGAAATVAGGATQAPADAARQAAATAAPSSAADAVAMTQAGLAFLASADATSWPAAAQADCLRALERAGAMHVAARARVLSAFAGQRGFEDDGQGSAGTWLRWQTRITRGAADGAVGWARRLAAHPAVADALAAGGLSASWAREICGWSDRLPAGMRADADEVLLGAAAGGAEFADLAGLAEEMYRRCAPPDSDGADDGFAERRLRLDLTFRNAGRLEGDLTPQCAAALQSVLAALGKKAGPEDARTKGQRDHDALEEACRRLIAAGCLPDRAGQPTQIQLHMTLDQLRGLPGAGDAEAAWAARGPAAAPGSECDASIVPIVSGHVDPAVLDRLAAALLGETSPDYPDLRRPVSPVSSMRLQDLPPAPGSPRLPAVPRSRPAPSAPSAAAAVRALVLRHAADLLSGPAGLGAFLRTGLLAGPAASISLPLDVGRATEEIPVHLRRAVILRDKGCGFPGCTLPPEACQVHHLIPKAQGGLTRLTDLMLACTFHHLIVVHRWGWQLILNPDGTRTAISPDGQRVLHSHSPPACAA